MYKIISDTIVYHLEEKLSIPNDPGNRHWQEYQMWLEKGNTPEPADTEPAKPSKDAAQTKFEGMTAEEKEGLLLDLAFKAGLI